MNEKEKIYFEKEDNQKRIIINIVGDSNDADYITDTYKYDALSLSDIRQLIYLDYFISGEHKMDDMEKSIKEGIDNLIIEKKLSLTQDELDGVVEFIYDEISDFGVYNHYDGNCHTLESINILIDGLSVKLKYKEDEVIEFIKSYL